jgi:hypothetical protein
VATWERRANLAALEKTLELEIAAANPDERRAYYEPFLFPPAHGFLVHAKIENGRWAYGSWNEKPRKEDYVLLLPDTIRKVFQTLVQPPAGYELSPMDALPSSAAAATVYSCAAKGIADLRLVAEYIAQGHLKYTKAERVAAPSLKALHKVTGGPEFFENSDNSDLALLRTRLLVGGMAVVGSKDREKLLAGADSAGPVRDLFAKVSVNAAFLHEELLPHLAYSRNQRWQYHPASVRHLASFFGKLRAQWIAWENIRTYHALRDERLTLFEPGGTLEANAIKNANEWSTSIFVNARNEFELVSEPLLKGFAFLLAAFGMAEIAYLPPKQPSYHRRNKDFLTPYDGLGFVRLTPLGEFVFGRRDTFEAAGGAPIRAAITLDETRLLATCRNADKLTELALARFMEEVAPGRYRMTPKSLLGGCIGRADIEERIRLFRRVVAAAPPAIWEEFFTRTLARIAPLQIEPDYIVLKFGGDDEIRRLLASDPILREITIKVEGLRIAVRRGDLKKLAKRLEQFGYLSPVPGA